MIDQENLGTFWALSYRAGMTNEEVPSTLTSAGERWGSCASGTYVGIVPATFDHTSYLV